MKSINKVWFLEPEKQTIQVEYVDHSDNIQSEVMTFNIENDAIKQIIDAVGGVQEIEKQTIDFQRQESEMFAEWQEFLQYKSRFNNSLEDFFKNYTEYEANKSAYKNFQQGIDMYTLFESMIHNKLESEQLFKFKLMLFERPELKECTDKTLKSQIRKSKNMFEIISLFHSIQKQ